MNDRVPSRLLNAALLSALLLSACGDGPAPTDGGDFDAATPAGDAGADAGPVMLCARDLECSDSLFCNGVERCMPGAAGAGADGCVAGNAPCAVGETCAEASQACTAARCDEANPDADGDGDRRPECGGADCDDSNAAVYSTATEECDAAGVDEDCNPATVYDEGTPGAPGDVDGDGYLADSCFNLNADGTENRGTDCNDAQSTIHPDAVEQCNGEDDDCDGLIDEGIAIECRRDGDGDGFAPAGAEMRRACGGCMVGFIEWTSTSQVDCDDTDSSVSPSFDEMCNGVDDDCDGSVDEAALDIGTREHCSVCNDSCQFACDSGSCDLPATIVTGAANCALTRAGRLFCWGRNGGAVGNGSALPQETPLRIDVAGGAVRQIATNGQSVCADALPGGINCWGRNTSGELGDGTTTRRLSPTSVSWTFGSTRSLSLGGTTACLIDEGYMEPLFCWGSDVHRRDLAGTWHQISSSTPRSTNEADAPSQILPHFWGGCSLSPVGQVLCWGNQFYAGRGPHPTGWQWLEPGPVALPGAASIVEGRGSTTCAVVAGDVWCWGVDDYGQLGNGAGAPDDCSGLACSLTPQRVRGGLSAVTDLWMGLSSACARTSTGETFCWGRNSAIGTDYPTKFPGLPTGAIGTPMRAPLLDRFDTLSFASWVTGSCGLDSSVMWCWGGSYMGVGAGDYGIRRVVPPL